MKPATWLDEDLHKDTRPLNLLQLRGKHCDRAQMFERSESTMTPQSHGKQSPRTLMEQLRVFLNITLRQRRVPGKCYRMYYNCLYALGRKIITIRVARGVRLKGLTTSFDMAQEVWSKRVYDHPGFTLHERTNVIDIGANQGFFTVYAASLGANVYAFEPSSDNFALLQHNISVNQYGDRVKPYRAAVTGAPGEVILHVGLDSRGEILSGSASIINTNRGGVTVKSESVPAVTFEEILRDNGIAFCDFLKIDCEGAEYDILQSISTEGFDRIGRISMETHGGRGREALELLKSRGFEILEFMDSEAGFIKACRVAP